MWVVVVQWVGRGWERARARWNTFAGMYSSTRARARGLTIFNVLPQHRATGKRHYAYVAPSSERWGGPCARPPGVKRARPRIVEWINIGTQKCVHRTVVRCAICVQLVGVHVSCSSHSDAHLAAVFIDPRAE